MLDRERLESLYQWLHDEGHTEDAEALKRLLALRVAPFNPDDEYENGVRLVAPVGHLMCPNPGCRQRIKLFVTDDDSGRVWGVVMERQQ